MSIKALQEYIRITKYARYLPEKKRRETWQEQVDRVFDMHEKKYENVIDKLKPYLDEARLGVQQKLLLGSQRALQFGGQAILDKNSRMYNCSYSHCDRPRFFGQMLFLLLNGCFHKDTEVLTKNGPKKISDVTLDDEILSYNIDADVYEYINPVAIHENDTEESDKLELTFEDGSIVKCTSNHEFYTTNRGWVKASDLTEEDDVKNFNQTHLSMKLKSIKKLDQDGQKYFDLTIPGNHNYVLANGSVVHNCGVGMSVQRQHIDKLPLFKKVDDSVVETIQIQDSIEGWSDAITALVSSYYVDVKLQGFEQYNGKRLKFDYSLIRPSTELIKSTGHKAPGPDGLRNSINKIVEILDRVTESGEVVKIRPIDAYDICMWLADCVVAGGSRRSATICLFSKDDEEMMKAKTGDWFYSNPQRGRSNNSVVLLRDSTTREEWAEIMKSVREFGEPGFAFVDDLEFGTNPCLAGDSVINLADNSWVRIDQLVTRFENGEAIEVKTLNETTGDIESKPITNAFLTKRNTQVIKLKFDNGQVLKLTPDHKVFTTNRGWVEATNLTTSDEFKFVEGSSEHYNESRTVSEYIDNEWRTHTITIG